MSSREQEREGFSLEVQEDALRRYATQAGGEIIFERIPAEIAAIRAQAEQALGGGETSSDEQSRFEESLAQLSQGDAGSESARNGEGGSVLGARETSSKTM